MIPSKSRVLTGQWKGRHFYQPGTRHCRVTLSRTRQALFDFLIHHPIGLKTFNETQILDLYAGSGSLAFEALSRGAAHATCIEKEKACIDVLKSNAKLFGAASMMTIIRADVPAWLAENNVAFDLIFADPPYRLYDKAWSWPQALQPASMRGMLKLDGLYVLQHDVQVERPPESDQLRLIRTLRQGKNQCSVYRVQRNRKEST